MRALELQSRNPCEISQDMLDIALDITAELAQLEAWIRGERSRAVPRAEVRKQDCSVDRVRRRLAFFREIYYAINTEAMRAVACSDEFWGDADLRQSVLHGVLNTMVYLRENLVHLIDRMSKSC